MYVGERKIIFLKETHIYIVCVASGVHRIASDTLTLYMCFCSTVHYQSVVCGEVFAHVIFSDDAAVKRVFFFWHEQRHSKNKNSV